MVIDSFSKVMEVIPIASKKVGDILAGIMEACKNLKCYPNLLYTDEEGGLYNSGVIEF